MIGDRNFLLGLFAVRQKKISPKQLAESVIDATDDIALGSSLFATAGFSDQDKAALESMVDEAVATHGGNVQATIQSLVASDEHLAKTFGEPGTQLHQDDVQTIMSAVSPAPLEAQPDDGSEATLATGSDALFVRPSSPDATMALEGSETFGPARDPFATIPTTTQHDTQDPNRTVSMDDTGRARVDRDIDPNATVPGTGAEQSTILTADSGATISTTPPNRRDLHQDMEATIATGPGAKPALGGLTPAQLTGEALVPAVEEHHGRYREVKVFGAGGMGKIYMMHDEHIGRDVALKTLLPNLGGGMHTRFTGAPTVQMLTVPIIARFLQEARVTGQLEHPSIVPVYEIGYREDGSLYYTMKLVKGHDLQIALNECKSINDRLRLLNHFVDLCQAIAYAHSRGVIHRDLKPMNVMIGEFGETVVIDWGIAKVRGEQDIHERGLRDTVKTLKIGDMEATAKTMYGQAMGSPYYMPPEQAEGRMDEIDERSDTYALGAVLYAILAGQPPYYGMKAREFLAKVSDFPPKPVREVAPDAPRELAAVCEKALERDPAKRYQNAQELREEVERYLSGGLVSAYDYKISELFKRYVKKHWKFLGTVTTCLIALLVAGVISYILVRQQRNHAERELYFADVLLSQNATDEYRMDTARERLAFAAGYVLDEDTKQFVPGSMSTGNMNWEWGLQQALANPDIMSLDAGGRYAAFTPDGGLLAAKSNGTVEKYSMATEEKTHTFAETTGREFVLAFNADNTRMAIAAPKFVAAWDTANGTELMRFEETDAPLSRDFVALSADGRMVAALNTDKQARVWEIGNKDAILSVPVPRANGFGISLSPAGDKLMIATQDLGADGMVTSFEVFALPQGKSLGKAELPAAYSIYTSKFSPDGKLLALGTNEALILWDTEAWQQEQILKAKFGDPDTIAFSTDGTLLAGACKEGYFGLWRVSDGAGSLIKAHEEDLRAVAFSHDGKWIATASTDRTALLWKVAEKDGAPAPNRLRMFRGHNQTIFGVAFNADDTLFATTSYDGKTKVWDLGADVENQVLNELVYSPNAGLLAGTLETETAVWDVRNGHRKQTFASGGVKKLALSDSGKILATCDKTNNGINLWDVATGATLRAIEEPGGEVTGMQFVDGDAALAVNMNSTMALRSCADGSEIWKRENIYGATTFSPDRTCMAFVVENENDYGVEVFRIGEAAPVAASALTNKKDCPDLVFLLAISPDNTRLYAAFPKLTGEKDYDARVISLDMASGTIVAEHIIPRFVPSAIATNLSGDTVAVGLSNGRGVLLSAAKFDNPRELVGHKIQLRNFAFSPDGTRLVTASGDRTFKLWDTEEGREILTIQDASRMAAGNVPLPEWAQFSPDAKQLVTLARDSTLVVPPIVLTAFPWNLDDYPPGDSLRDRIEAYKRSLLKN